MFNFKSNSLKLSSKRLHSSLALVAIAAIGSAMTPAKAETNGFYGQIDLGLGIIMPTDKTMKTKSTTFESITKPADSERNDLQTTNFRGIGSFLSLGIGYAFNDFVALDLNFRGGALPPRVTDRNDKEKNDTELVSANSMSIMPKVHGYYPLGEKSRIGAFVGAGYGFNRHMQEITKLDGTTTVEVTEKENFVWSAGFEYGYLLEENLRLNVTAGYTDLGKIEWNNSTATTTAISNGYSTVTKVDRYSQKLSSVDLTVGIAYQF
ncbi:MAG: OmpW family outer membrane protein [Candidatus Pacebacteria bacterium]|nr:OmpW family outer membrane protein [Candidatus Paceibacterota bacterium]